MSERLRYRQNPHVVLIKDLIEQEVSDINTMIPASIHSYDQTTGRASVTPLFKIVLKSLNPDGTRRSIVVPPISDVPVMFFGNKETQALVDIKTGDSGILLFSQRSLDEWKAGLEEGGPVSQYAPKDLRRFDINDAVFFPAYLAGETSQFRGIKSSEDVSVETTRAGSNVSIKTPSSVLGTEDGGTKVKIKGLTLDLPDVLEDLQNQISRNQNSIMSVASSTPLTAPSLPVVLSNNLFSKITSKITYIQKKLSFSDGALSLASLFLKAVSINSNGEIQRAQPVETTADPPPIEVILRQKLVYNSPDGIAFDEYGWALPGLDNFITGITIAGDADFSPLMGVDETLGNLVGFFIRGAPNTSTPVKLILYFGNKITLEAHQALYGILVSIKPFEEANFETDVLEFITGQADFESITGTQDSGLFKIEADNIINADNQALQNKFKTEVTEGSFFSNLLISLGGGDTRDNLRYPILYIRFLNRFDELLTIDLDKTLERGRR